MKGISFHGRGDQGRENHGNERTASEATTRLGGFSDACHSLTAATTVAIGKEEKLIDEMEKIIQGELNG